MDPTQPNHFNLPGAAVSALQQGKVIEAVKIVRESNGMGLKDAKDMVDSYISSRPDLQTKISASQAQTNRRCLVVLVLLSALIAALVFWFRRA